jgi:antitoxin (DNA-binding transcriptional repressor) of toxin-antitoxin stability system
MRIITAKVVNGKIELEGEVRDGTTVTILAPGPTGFRLSPTEEEELAHALAEIRSGDFVDGTSLLDELKGRP